MAPLRSICVYCGSQNGADQAWREAGRALGRAMGEAGIRLVYGGGAKGVMGAVAQAAMEAGGSVTGVIPRFLVAKEANEDSLSQLTETVFTENMHERKHVMFERADAFVALPGGIGTLEELVEIMTWAQLGRHEKPIVLANIKGFWNPLLDLFEHMRAQGFIHTQSKVKPLVVENAADIVPTLVAWRRGRDAGGGDEAALSRM